MTAELKRDLFNPIYLTVVGGLKWIGIVFVCLFVAVLIEVIGEKTIWKNVDGSRLLHRTQLEQNFYWNQSMNIGLLRSPIKLSQLINSRLRNVVDAFRDYAEIGDREAETELTSLPIRAVLTDVQQWGKRQLLLVSDVIQACIFRLCAYLSCLLCTLPFVVVSFSDGLVRREIRRLSGGRESSWVYTITHRSLRPLLMFFLIVFLIWPWVLDYAWVTCGLGVLLVAAVHFATSRLKKYL